MNKRITATITALIAMLVFNTSVYASPSANNSPTSQISGDTTTQTSQVQNLDNNSINVQIQNLEISIENMDNQIEQTLSNINDNNNEITKNENEIINLQEQIDGAESDIKDHEAALDKIARAFYISGVDGYVQVLMDSKNLDDFISRTDSIIRIIGFDKNIINDLNQEKQNITSNKEKLQEGNKKLLILKADNEEKIAKLNEDKENENKLLEQLQIEQKAIATNNTDNNNLTISNLSADSLPSKNNDIIAYAYKFLGTPYLWGGTTPDGFDCSGFVQYVYAHFGIKIDRTTYEQIKDGVEVSKDKLNPGDLVFFGTTDDPHHVGMYIGNGMYIHAPHTGDVIKVSVLADRNDYLTARRVK